MAPPKQPRKQPMGDLGVCRRRQEAAAAAKEREGSGEWELVKRRHLGRGRKQMRGRKPLGKRKVASGNGRVDPAGK